MAVIDKFPHSFPGTFIAKVQAVPERITGAQITYSLANDKGWFEINSTTGVITVARTLDREVHVIIHYYHKGFQFEQVLKLLKQFQELFGSLKTLVTSIKNKFRPSAHGHLILPPVDRRHIVIKDTALSRLV